jgi:hypothetical protein
MESLALTVEHHALAVVHATPFRCSLIIVDLQHWSSVELEHELLLRQWFINAHILCQFPSSVLVEDDIA